MDSALVEDKVVIELSKKVLAYTKFFSQEQNLTAIPVSVRPALLETSESATKITGAFKLMFISNVQAPFRKALVTLSVHHAGGPEGTDWHLVTAKPCSWKEFLMLSKDNIRTLQKVHLIEIVQAADNAKLTYETRAGEVEVETDSDLIKEAEEKIKLGRRTVCEVMLLEGLFQSLREPERAVTTLNSCIAQMAVCDLEQEHIEPNVWDFVSKVLAGEKLRCVDV